MSSETATPPGDSLEPIKHVASTEAELETKVAQLRATIKSALEELARETERVVLQARGDAERAREALVASAQRDGDLEAKEILAKGGEQAAGIRGKTAPEIASQKEPILSAVLAEFRSSGKRPGA